MTRKPAYNLTFLACYIAYAVQAVVNNFAPLLFVTFSTEFRIPLTTISLLIGMHFGVQMVADLVIARFADRVGYRNSVVAAHLFAALGLALLAFLPDLLPNPFVGILIADLLYAIGGGLIEAVTSPLFEACPAENKEAAMSILHSFYSWGQLASVLLCSLFFVTAGISRWRLLSLLWALLPLANAVLFCAVPVVEPSALTEKRTPLPALLRRGAFWVMLLLMLGAGASELTVCQWASAFLETCLGIDKQTGDLIGLCCFSLFMGLARVLYSAFSERLRLPVFMAACGGLCIISYLMITCSLTPAVVLAGCALCGFSVGIMWPGTYALAAKCLAGGTSMFALLALAGDVGCTLGPSLAGALGGAFGGNLSLGILLCIAFPVIFTLGSAVFIREKTEKTE